MTCINNRKVLISVISLIMISCMGERNISVEVKNDTDVIISVEYNKPSFVQPGKFEVEPRTTERKIGEIFLGEPYDLNEIFSYIMVYDNDVIIVDYHGKELDSNIPRIGTDDNNDVIYRLTITDAMIEEALAGETTVTAETTEVISDTSETTE